MDLPKSAQGIKFDPLLKINNDGVIERVCHFYPEKYVFHGGWACCECEKRAKCNANLFDRLAAYEMSQLSPEVVMAYKTFEDEVIAAGLTFKDLVDHINILKGMQK